MLFLDEHQDTLEGDYLRFFGLDLHRDLGGPRLTWRRFGVLLAQLPPDSATSMSIDPQEALWTLPAHLIARAVEALEAANWQRAGKESAPRPPSIPRPGVETAEDRRQAAAKKLIERRDREVAGG